MHRPLPTQSDLKDWLRYEPETGKFYWRKSRGHGASRVNAGQEAGCCDKGYIKIRFMFRKHLAHRLAWLYVFGTWPVSDIDHINMDGTDNRLENLRPCNKALNGANTGIRCTNTSGIKGVTWHKQSGRWEAKCRRKTIGRFTTKEEASAAYENAAIIAFGEFARIA